MIFVELKSPGDMGRAQDALDRWNWTKLSPKALEVDGALEQVRAALAQAGVAAWEVSQMSAFDSLKVGDKVEIQDSDLKFRGQTGTVKEVLGNGRIVVTESNGYHTTMPENAVRKLSMMDALQAGDRVRCPDGAEGRVREVGQDGRVTVDLPGGEAGSYPAGEVQKMSMFAKADKSGQPLKAGDRVRYKGDVWRLLTTADSDPKADIWIASERNPDQDAFVQPSEVQKMPKKLRWRRRHSGLDRRMADHPSAGAARCEGSGRLVASVSDRRAVFAQVFEMKDAKGQTVQVGDRVKVVSRSANITKGYTGTVTAKGGPDQEYLTLDGRSDRVFVEQVEKV